MATEPGVIAKKRKEPSLSAKQRDSYGTPKEVYTWLDREFHFLGDMAASNTNHLHPRVWFTQERSCLTLDWHLFLSHNYNIVIKPGNRRTRPSADRKNRRLGVPYVFINFPYSEPDAFLRKIVIEWRKGVGVVVVMKTGDGELYWQDYCEGKVSEMYIITGRLAHRHPETLLPVKGSSFGSTILVYDPEVQDPQFTETHWIDKKIFDHL
jgi:phage N-6-adenine-methyltransferase